MRSRFGALLAPAQVGVRFTVNNVGVDRIRESAIIKSSRKSAT